MAESETPEGVEVEIKESREQWSSVDLADGTTIRLKTVVVEVKRSEEEYDAEGNPAYRVRSQIIFDVRAPDKLRKKQ